MKDIQISKNILTENNKIIQDYFKDVQKCKLYSSEEQIELARLAKAGDLEARDKLIKSNLRFVITCAKQYVNQGVPLVDLINSGNLGLILAITNFDPDRGYKFLSFAVWYIRREIIKSIYDTGRTIRYPVTYISKITKVKKAYDDFVTKNERNPSDEELINLTNLTQKQYDSTIINKSYCESLDAPINENSDATIKDTLVGDSTNIEDVFTKDAIHKCLKILDDREYQVITSFYGLDGQIEKPIKEIAKDMGLGPERVRQLRKGAIKKLLHRKGNTLKVLL